MDAGADRMRGTYNDWARYAKMYDSFLSSGKMVGTYKAVLLRSLADLGLYSEPCLVGRRWIGHRDGRIMLNLDFVAARFAKYYWDMHAGFGLRHTPHRSRGGREDADTIISLIDNEQAGRADQNPPELAELASDKMEGFRCKVARLCVARHAIDAVLTDMPGLYEKVGKEYIELEPGLVAFLREHRTLIRKSLNCILAQHLERINPEARHIATKIDGETPLVERQAIIAEMESRAGAPPG
ncbi:hypothetical protein CENSYa_0414 [Cenarchaeum symbiosum A]|uniref:Uncharacterized protein n=1 Tax=Cenarchaeum symbiosum (strain A) TaxID=414004 RepID=A0RUN2_CENSY|nr:hypothetical protein CENSYa_0414 [Cenarchaeum symbiosum A]